MSSIVSTSGNMLVSLSSHLKSSLYLTHTNTLAHSREARLQGGWTGCGAAAITNTQVCFGAERQISPLQGHKELIFPSTRQTLINLCRCCLLPSAFISPPCCAPPTPHLTRRCLLVLFISSALSRLDFHLLQAEQAGFASWQTACMGGELVIGLLLRRQWH